MTGIAGGPHEWADYKAAERIIWPAILEEGRRRAALDGSNVDYRPVTIVADWAGVDRRTAQRWRTAGRVPLYALDRIAAHLGRWDRDLFGHVYDALEVA